MKVKNLLIKQIMNKIAPVVALGLALNYSGIVLAQSTKTYFILGDASGSIISVYDSNNNDPVLNQTYSPSGERKDADNQTGLINQP